MARTLDDFIASLPEEEQQAIHQETERLIAEEMTLRALRQARARSQEEVGHLLHIKQAAVSRLERRTDMYVSTLRAFIEAMGGELDIIARFPDHTSVRINQFEELGEATPAYHSAPHRDHFRAPDSARPRFRTSPRRTETSGRRTASRADASKAVPS